MKNLFLGFLMTAGFSGMALSNTNIIKNNVVTDIDNLPEFSYGSVDATLDCTVRYIQRWYNCDGSFNDQTTAIVDSSECEGAPDGSAVIVVTRVDGCPTGPLDPGFEILP